jgi:hypothetical protein
MTSRTWLARNVRQVCDGGARRFDISRETVRSATSMPSFLSSPWILGAPPQEIHRRHCSDEGGDLRVDRRAAHPRAAGEPRPVLTEATVLPPQDSVGRHDDQSLPPAGPDSGQPNPQEAICPAQPGPGYRSLVHGELVTQGEVLEGELAVAAAEEGEESQQVEHEGDHQARILSGSELIDHRPRWPRTIEVEWSGLPSSARPPGGTRETAEKDHYVDYPPLCRAALLPRGGLRCRRLGCVGRTRIASPNNSSGSMVPFTSPESRRPAWRLAPPGELDGSVSDAPRSTDRARVTAP